MIDRSHRQQRAFPLGFSSCLEQLRESFLHRFDARPGNKTDFPRADKKRVPSSRGRPRVANRRPRPKSACLHRSRKRKRPGALATSDSLEQQIHSNPPSLLVSGAVPCGSRCLDLQHVGGKGKGRGRQRRVGRRTRPGWRWQRVCKKSGAAPVGRLCKHHPPPSKRQAGFAMERFRGVGGRSRDLPGNLGAVVGGSSPECRLQATGG